MYFWSFGLQLGRAVECDRKQKRNEVRLGSASNLEPSWTLGPEYGAVAATA